MPQQPPEYQQCQELATKINNVRESLIRLEAEATKLGLPGIARDLLYQHEQLFVTVQALRGGRKVNRGYAEL